MFSSQDFLPFFKTGLQNYSKWNNFEINKVAVMSVVIGRSP
jgi:hypothetical protein